MSHPKSEILSGPPAICNSSFLHFLYFGYVMRGTVRVRRTWMRWLEWRLLSQAVEGFKRLLENVYFGGSDNKRFFFRVVEDWMDADICWRHSLIPPPRSRTVVYKCDARSILSYVARPKLFPGVSKAVSENNILTLMWVIILMLNNVAEAVKECRSAVCSHILNSWQIVLTLTLLTWRIWWAPNNASKWQMGFSSAFKGLNPKIGWVEQNIWAWSKVRFDRLRCTATCWKLEEQLHSLL